MNIIDRKIILLMTLLLTIQGLAYSQNHEKKTNKKDKAVPEKHSKEEKERRWEIIVSGIGIYSVDEDKWSPAIESHITYWITHKWALGPGYSIVFDVEGKNIEHELVALVSHKPIKFLTLNFGPSFSLPNKHKHFEAAAYIETEFAFNVKKIHLGPTFGATVGEKFRIFGGFHLSYEF